MLSGPHYDSVADYDESNEVLLRLYFILTLHRLYITFIFQRYEAMNQYINYSPKERLMSCVILLIIRIQVSTFTADHVSFDSVRSFKNI